MFWTVTLDLLRGFGATLQIFGLTLVFALPLGLVICFGTMLSVFLITLIMPVSYWRIFIRDRRPKKEVE